MVKEYFPLCCRIGGWSFPKGKSTHLPAYPWEWKSAWGYSSYFYSFNIIVPPPNKTTSSVIQITSTSLNWKNKEHLLITNVCMSVCGVYWYVCVYIHKRLHVSIFVCEGMRKVCTYTCACPTLTSESYLSLPYSVRLGVVVSVSNECDRTYSHLGHGPRACLQGLPTVDVLSTPSELLLLH